MTPEKLARIAEWRAKLLEAEPDSTLGKLAGASRQATVIGVDGHDFGREVEKAFGGELLDIVGMCLRAGYMPPAEILLTLVDSWMAYRAEDQRGLSDAMTANALERHLISPPVQKAGNYARRCQSIDIQFSKDLHVLGAVADMLTPEERKNPLRYARARAKVGRRRGINYSNRAKVLKRKEKKTDE